MNDIYENIDEYNLNRNKKISIVFDDLIADILSGKNTKLFFLFTTQSYFVVPKNIRLNPTLYFIIKITNKRDVQQTTINLSLDVNV